MAYALSLFIFRRDLHLHDNKGLLDALQKSKKVLLCFFFDPRQIGATNQYRTPNGIQFMIDSLAELERECSQYNAKLFFFEGLAHTVLKKLIKALPIDAVFCNRDYTPFSQSRDKKLRELCYEKSIPFEYGNDLLLLEPETIATATHKPYTVFSAFYKKALTHEIEKPMKLGALHSYTHSIPFSISLTSLRKKLVPSPNKELAEQPGRKAALAILKNVKKHFHDYATIHDKLSNSTTHLSAHLKFGTISIREAAYTIQKQLGKKHPLLRQLYWRDFFTHIGFHFPHVYGQSFHKKYDRLTWSSSKTHFQAWCEGKTGFPIVDAGMRELLATGYMHNRARLITGSFLVKDLHIDWRAGEKFFAQHLVDYDPAINNGNWQWVASTGCDAQPYFRIFNPWLQQKKFDPQCLYIKHWVPELVHLNPKQIHEWFKETSPSLLNYSRPIVDHTTQAAKAKKAYRR